MCLYHSWSLLICAFWAFAIITDRGCGWSKGTVDSFGHTAIDKRWQRIDDRRLCDPEERLSTCRWRCPIENRTGRILGSRLRNNRIEIWSCPCKVAIPRLKMLQSLKPYVYAKSWSKFRVKSWIINERVKRIKANHETYSNQSIATTLPIISRRCECFQPSNWSQNMIEKNKKSIKIKKWGDKLETLSPNL